MTEENHLVVVDDEPQICEFITDVARANGYQTHACRNLDALCSVFKDARIDLLLLDLHMPDHDGVEVLRMLAGIEHSPPVLLMSGEGRSVLEAAQRLGKQLGLRMLGIVEKPIELETLETMLGRHWKGRWVITEDALSQAVHNEELVPFFQPKLVRGQDGVWRVGDVEALIRWRHPRYGLITPDHFIPIAEESAIIGDLTESVIHQSAQALEHWRRHGLHLGLSVNIATVQLGNIDLPDRLLALARHHGLDPKMVTLEVTERGTMRDSTAATDVLTRCRLKHFNVSMDDFGTGYSSLTHLVELPFNELKIDKRFVIDADVSERSRIIVRSCIALAHSLGLEVCAEGVESRATLDLLDRLGCERAQGFYISQPVPADDIPDICENFTFQRVPSTSAQTA